MTELEAEITPRDEGWEIRLPLRREVVKFEKHTLVAEEVTIHREHNSQTHQVEATVRRERLRVDTFGDLEASELEVRRRPTT
jgi:uncharacterized protein (TIGR02271 family)